MLIAHVFGRAPFVRMEVLPICGVVCPLHLCALSEDGSVCGREAGEAARKRPEWRLRARKDGRYV